MRAKEFITEADVEYSSTKQGKRMHKIGDIYGKKKTAKVVKKKKKTL